MSTLTSSVPSLNSVLKVVCMQVILSDRSLMVNQETKHLQEALKQGTAVVLSFLLLLSAPLCQYSWLPDVLRLEGSVSLKLYTLLRYWDTYSVQITTRILGPVLTVTLFASLVTYGWRQGYNVTLTNSVTPLLAVVVSIASMVKDM